MDIWKVLFSSLLSVVALFLIAKLMGHKQIAQLDFFDYIAGITFGSIAAELATELETPERPLIAMAVYGVCSVLFSLLSQKMPRLRKYINGAPTILFDAGKLYRKNLKSAKLDLSEFMVMCREQGYFDLSEVQTAILEPNGKLSVLSTSKSRPVTPSDLSLSPAPAHIAPEVILDGRILHQNLKRMGLDVNWLQKQLREQNFGDARDVFLACVSIDRKLRVYPSAERE